MDWNALFKDLFEAGSGYLGGMNQGGTVINNYEAPESNALDLSNPMVLIGGALILMIILKK